jgi:hypothetical protein
MSCLTDSEVALVGGGVVQLTCKCTLVHVHICSHSAEVPCILPTMHAHPNQHYVHFMSLYSLTHTSTPACVLTLLLGTHTPVMMDYCAEPTGACETSNTHTHCICIYSATTGQIHIGGIHNHTRVNRSISIHATGA